MSPKLQRYAQDKFQSQHFREQAFTAFKLAVSVSLGTLLSLVPGYAGLFSTPFSLADQCIFTVLGGVNLTVGGLIEQFLWRFVVGSSLGAASYAIIQILGGAPAAQGFIFFVLVLVQSYYVVKIPKAGIGLQFATLASVYAVDQSYRDGNVYAINGDRLTDLLKAWAFGAAISVGVNFLVLPVKASRLTSVRTIDALKTIRNVAGWMLGDEEQYGAFASPSAVRQQITVDAERLSAMQDQLAWETAWSASTLDQRVELTTAVLELQTRLVVSSRDGPFLVDLPADLAAIMRPAIQPFAKWALESIDNILLLLKTDKHQHGDSETLESPPNGFVQARMLFDRAAAEVTDAVIATLRTPKPDPTRLASLDRATHCLDATLALADAIIDLERLVLRDANRPKRVHVYVLQTVVRNCRAPFTSSAPRLPSPPPGPRTFAALLPTMQLRRRVLTFITSFESRYAFKVAGALCCLQAILWAETSRAFYTNYVVRNSTVPLLLALMPNVGLSVVSWLGQLTGACIGTAYACLIMLIWRGVGSRPFSLPGIFFFQFFLSLAVGGRMLNGPDFLAVTAQNACAIFILLEFYTGEALGLRLGYMLTTCAIAIALAIPFQLLLFPNHARDGLRSDAAATLRRLAALALDEIDLSSHVLLTDDVAYIKSRAATLSAEVADIKASLRSQDGLVDLAAAEWSTHDGFDPLQAHAIVEALHRCADVMDAHISICAAGPVDPRIRALLGANNESAAQIFGEACSSVFWCLGASWSLLETPPAPLPSVDMAAEALLRELEQPTTSASSGREWMESDVDARVDVRRWWSLSLTLVTQRTEIANLVRVMGADWRQERKPQKPPTRRLMSEGSKFGGDDDGEKPRIEDLVPAV